ncbi:MAG: hypothetical protein Q8T08_23155, partial [Ignavibacteria bacterium]|nr:hypothetical protein [Ignavibacteria bacterium]
LKDVSKIYAEMKPRGFVFFLGAGASVEVGIPTSLQMLERLEQLKPKSKKEDILLRKVLASKSCKNIEDFVQTLPSIENLDSFELTEFVKSWSIPLNTKSYVEAATSLKNQVLSKLFTWLQPKHDTSYFKNLFHFSSQRIRNKKNHVIKVFSLNYDLSIEKSCDTTSVNCWTGFDEYRNMEPTPYLYWDPNLFGNPGINLYKLHGSLNWGVMKPRKNMVAPLTNIVGIRPYLMGNKPFSFGRESWLPAEDKKRTGFYLDSWSNLRGMIFGVRDKLVGYEPFLFLQSEFNKALALTNVLVVIGYGWNDPYINLRIKRIADTSDPPIIIDVSRDAIKSAKEEKRIADIYIGGGAKAALSGEKVTVVIKSRIKNDFINLEIEDGIVGALKKYPKLFSLTDSNRYPYPDRLDRFIDKIFEESYFDKLI